jgi:hypothetical protein
MFFILYEIVLKKTLATFILTQSTYSLSIERLIDIKITKFYTEKVLSSARKI